MQLLISATMMCRRRETCDCVLFFIQTCRCAAYGRAPSPLDIVNVFFVTFLFFVLLPGTSLLLQPTNQRLKCHASPLQPTPQQHLDGAAHVGCDKNLDSSTECTNHAINIDELNCINSVKQQTCAGGDDVHVLHFVEIHDVGAWPLRAHVGAFPAAR